MTEPSATPDQSNAPVVIRIILAVLCMLPGVIGLLVLGAIAFAFAYEGFRFLDSDRQWMQLFLIGAAFFIAPSVIALGIILRFARWKKAPTASLVLAIIFLVADVIGTGMLETTLDPGDIENWHLLLVSSGIGLLIGALPPFLHWWKSAGRINP